MSNNNFSIVGTYDGTIYNITDFTFGPNDTNLMQYINNKAVPPQIINNDDKKQKLLELFKSTKPANNKPTKYDVEPIEPNLIVIESNENEENPLLRELIKLSEDTENDGEHIIKKTKTKICDNQGSIILDNTNPNKLEGFEIVDTYGDGTCFFYAFIMALCNLDSKYNIITSRGIRTFLSNLEEDEIKNIFGENEFDNRFNDKNNINYQDFNNFKTFIKIHKNYADDNVLSILGHLFGILFVINRLSVNSGSTEINKEFLGSIDPKYYVFLLLSNNNHYDLLSYNNNREFFTNDDAYVITEKLKEEINQYKSAKLVTLPENTMLTVLGGKKRKTRKNRNKRRKTNKRTP
jgi:hypothetical protein